MFKLLAASKEKYYHKVNTFRHENPVKQLILKSAFIIWVYFYVRTYFIANDGKSGSKSFAIRFCISKILINVNSQIAIVV